MTTNILKDISNLDDFINNSPMYSIIINNVDKNEKSKKSKKTKDTKETKDSIILSEKAQEKLSKRIIEKIKDKSKKTNIKMSSNKIKEEKEEKKYEEKEYKLKSLLKGIQVNNNNNLQIYSLYNCEKYNKLIAEKTKTELFKIFRNENIENINSLYRCLYNNINEKSNIYEEIKDNLDKLLYIKFNILKDYIDFVLKNTMLDSDVKINKLIKIAIVKYMNTIEEISINYPVENYEKLNNLVKKYKYNFILYVEENKEIQQNLNREF